MNEVLTKLQKEIDELEAQGKELVDAKNFEEADEVKAKLQAKRAEMKREIMFSEDEAKRSPEAQAKLRKEAEKIDEGEVAMSVKEIFGIEERVEVDVKSKLYEDAWVKSVMNQALTASDVEVINAVNNFTHTTDNTALLVPNTIAAGIWARIDEMFPLWAAVPKTRVKGTLTYQKYKGHKETTDWYDDDQTEVEATEFMFGELTLNGCELAKAAEVSFKMLAMSREEFVPFITNRLGDIMGFALAYGTWQGAGVVPNEKPEPVGIKTELLENDTDQILGYTELTYQDLTKLMGRIHSPYLAGSEIYATSDTIWDVLANVLDKNGRPIFVANPIRGGVGTIFGRAVKPAAELPEGTILLANMDKGYRANINQDISVFPDVQARKRKIDYTTYAVVDGGVVDTKAFVILENPNAVAGLQGISPAKAKLKAEGKVEAKEK